MWQFSRLQITLTNTQKLGLYGDFYVIEIAFRMVEYTVEIIIEKLEIPPSKTAGLQSYLKIKIFIPSADQDRLFSFCGRSF